MPDIIPPPWHHPGSAHVDKGCRCIVFLMVLYTTRQPWWHCRHLCLLLVWQCFIKHVYQLSPGATAPVASFVWWWHTQAGYLNTHHPPSGSGHLCDLHKASLASSGTTRAAHVLTKAAAGTSYRRRYIWQVKDTGRPVPALPPTLHQVSFICWIILHFIVDYFSDLGNYKLCWEMINEQKISINEYYICIQLYF